MGAQFSGVLLLLLLSAPPQAQEEPAILDVQAICMADKNCHVKVTMGHGGGKNVVVTTFRANRVGPDMKYFRGEEYGSFQFSDAGLFYLDSPVLLDASGTMRAPTPEDPPENVFTFTMNVSADPQGHVTFFYGFVHGPDVPLVQRVWLWGYPPTTLQTRGAIGGPRSPVVPREPPPERVLRGGVTLKFRLDCDPGNHCRVAVGMDRERAGGIAITHFRANTLGEDMRYFPCEKEAGTDLLVGGGTYHVNLDVVLDEVGAMRSAQPWDDRADVVKMTSTVALDDSGHATFFYGFVRDPGSSRVRRFILWGYPPGTLMVDDPDEKVSRSEGDL